MIKTILLAAALSSVTASVKWTDPVEVRYDEKRCLSYRARWSGDYLLVEAAVEPGWHTFAMDNKERQDEKLAGKPSLGIEKSTEIKLADGLESAGPWLQSEPKDLSKPEIRWFTWGFDRQATFAVKANKSGAGPARVRVRGQACSEAICKNIDVTLEVPLTAKANPEAEPEIKSLKPVRPKRGGML